ncbi:hypothetical protein [Microbacterium sp. PM5]|uniref:hypothetical protein n=1 Tax=Microbacterium sp. PM5 TaxID=2014534 RepID=UPI000DD17009|nr:hypothetical protein [Microbacterium sp. PM5]AXA95439.1 hypothetical protein CEP17_02845 [Microbacterium sp. PM5]
MTLEYVRRYYGVPAIRGRRVTYMGRPGRITSADHRIRVRFDGDEFSSIIHPTEEGLVYLGAFGQALWPETAEWVTAPDGEEFRVGQCQGHAACPVERNEHGCYADDGTNCDHPDEHPRPGDPS